MFIFNHLENLIFGKSPTEEIKRENAFLNKESNFNEVLHQTLNEAARVDSDNLQTYSVDNEVIPVRKEITSLEPYKTEFFNEKIYKDTKEGFDYSSLTSKDISTNETISFKSPEPMKFEDLPLNNNNHSLEIGSDLKENESLALIEEIAEVKMETKVLKEISSEILLLAFSKLDMEEQSKKVVKSVSTEKINLDTKGDDKKSSSAVKVLDLVGQTSISPKSAQLELESKESKKIVSKEIAGNESLTKPKEVKVETETKEIFPKEQKREIPKDSDKLVKLEDNGKLTQTQSKSKEVPVINQKVQIEIKSDSNVQMANALVGKEELSTPNLATIDLRKSKKNSEMESKDKSNSENLKPVLKEFVTNEKEFRMSKETLIEVSGLDKNKWTITRREKEVEHANLERKKESVSLLNEISLKSSASQTSTDSEKSFSNSRFDSNGFKAFSESMKTANTDKPREAGFDRENFSKSLNELVNKARLNIVDNGRNSAQISLYPKDLGKMTLNIDVTKEKVDGKILVDSEFVKNRLLSDITQLKADLKANGLDLQSISVEVRDHSSLAFDFANPSNEKESSNGKSEETNTSLPQVASVEEQLESHYSNKSYNLVDIKI